MRSREIPLKTALKNSVIKMNKPLISTQAAVSLHCVTVATTIDFLAKDDFLPPHPDERQASTSNEKGENLFNLKFMEQESSEQQCSSLWTTLFIPLA